jgi:hypothetical protein
MNSIETKLWRKANTNALENTMFGLSDMCEENNSIEWCSIYGRHWERYATSEDFNSALDEYEARLDEEINAEYQRLVSERNERLKTIRETKNTLGNLFPQLNELR